MQKKGIKVQMATASDIENLTEKLDSMFKEGLAVYEKALLKMQQEVNAVIKPMVTQRAQLFNELQSFKASYKSLVGKDAGTEVPFVKLADSVIKRADVQISDLTKKLAKASSN